MIYFRPLIGIVALLFVAPACTPKTDAPKTDAAKIDSAKAAAPTAARVRQMLQTSNFAELDRRFGNIQEAFVAGQITEQALLEAFRAFYDSDPYIAPRYKDWVARSPNSYVAHLARGIYLRKLGEALRGDALSSETTKQQFADMREAHSGAEQEFETSLSLDRKPVLTYLHYMEITSHRGDRARTRELFEKGMSIAPESFILRGKYLSTLQTRWGGSTEQMRAFVDECRAAGFTQSQMAHLNSLVLEDEAWVLEHHDGDLDAAAAAYARSDLLFPGSGCDGCGLSEKRAEVYTRQKKYDETIEVTSEFLRKHPDDMKMLSLRGNAYLKLLKGPEAKTDLLRASELGDRWSQVMYAKMLLAGHLVAADRNEAIKWLTEASKQTEKPDDEVFVLLDAARNPKAEFDIEF